MNLQYGYPEIEVWAQGIPEAPPSALEVLVRALGQLPEARGTVDQNPAYQQDWAEVKRSPDYHYKTGCIDDPVVVEDLNRRGLHYESLEMGATRWLVLVPMSAWKEQNRRVPLLLVFHQEDYEDPFWAMKTLEHFESYNNAVAEQQDRTLIYIVTNHGPANMYAGMITEGLQNYCGDKDKVYVDLSLLRKNGMKLIALEGFHYEDAKGATVADPEDCVEDFAGIPVLSFSRRWVPPWRPHPIDAAGDGTVNRDWMIHSETGRKLLEERLFAAAHSTPNDPAAQLHWQQMGLRYGCHYVHGERWVIFTPSQTTMEKLPVVICLHEVNEPNDHGVITAFATFREYCIIAAQGDCAVLFFAMESPSLNDWLCDILRDAAGMYPLDLSRVYITGHSHNGHFAQEFARRHPEAIACVAPLGNSPGLPTPAVSHEAVAVDDVRATRMETMDMPTCILCGCKEVGCLVPINQVGHAFEAGINVEGYAASTEGKIAMWNRRLKAERCAQQSVEVVLAAADSGNKATRALGFPSDRAETLYIDGFEHYVADIKNLEGKMHFQVVAIENMPHMVVPSMHRVAWNYMRRFARDQETGAVIELW